MPPEVSWACAVPINDSSSAQRIADRNRMVPTIEDQVWQEEVVFAIVVAADLRAIQRARRTVSGRAWSACFRAGGVGQRRTPSAEIQAPLTGATSSVVAYGSQLQHAPPGGVRLPNSKLNQRSSLLAWLVR